jgi:hypothetical protein
MTANEVIRGALKPFGYPCKPDLYAGGEKKYFTFNYADERGADYGDNEPGCTLASMQIHFFLPADEKYIREKKKIREALHQAGFTYPAVTELVDKEENVRHIVYECDITEEREDE